MITIRFEVETGRRTRTGTCTVKEKSFPTEEAMQKWIARHEARPDTTFVGVLAYSEDPK